MRRTPLPSVIETSCSAPVALAHGPANIPLGLRLLLVLPLVIELLAACHSELYLGAPVLEVHPQRYQREAALRCLVREFLNFAAMQKKLPRPFRLMIEPVAHRVLRDIAPD